MHYTLSDREGMSWRILEDEKTHRWLLWSKRHGAWKKVASYSSPGAAALAVAFGETGEFSPENSAPNPEDYKLTNWELA